ncbi:MAG: 3-deoxy-D-manno-octulosonic acid kinase [Gammaproteobacteria bacterium]|nr:MAG: 3-deoxy-D-manno-octulosonic acid kinase [Gammaproteobacteria bacterium]
MKEACRAIDGGAMLYDAELPAAAQPGWFEPAWWRARGALTGEAGGRGTALLLDAGEAVPGAQWVLRRFRRGGLIRRLIDRHYLWLGEARTRGFAEWRLLAQLYEAGLPVPRPVAARYRRCGGLFYVAELITARLPENRTLRELYTDDDVPPDVWPRVGAVLRRMHEAGACHTDLNAGNLLVTGEGEVFIVDFDQGSLRRPGRWQAGNLARLRRSLRKTAVQGGRDALAPEHWAALLRGYHGDGDQSPA